MVIHSFLIKDFIRRIVLSRSRRKKYYKDENNIPKKYLKDPDRYKFVSGVLYDTDESTKVVKNTRTAGKPKFQKISGNDMWAGMNHHLRSKIATEMKKYFYEFFRGTKPLTENDYPIGISLVITDNLSGRAGEDIDNMAYLYRKNIHDALCGNVSFNKVMNGEKATYVPDREAYPAIIEDDNRDFITEIKTKIIVDETLTDEETSILIEIYAIDD